MTPRTAFASGRWRRWASWGRTRPLPCRCCASWPTTTRARRCARPPDCSWRGSMRSNARVGFRPRPHSDQGGSRMKRTKRWLPFGVLALLSVAAAAYVLWAEVLRHGRGTAPPQASIKATATDPQAAKVEAAVKKLYAEFNAGNTMPSAEARRQIQELAALGRRGQAMLPVVEAWLKRMHDRGQFSSA